MSKSPTKESELEKQLGAACRGLVYVSEIDSSVEPFFGKNPTKPKTSAIVFDEFFDRATAKKDWYTESERKNAEGFAELKDLLETELEDLQVYKTGRVQIEIIVIGRDKNGEFAGVRMKAVET